MLGSAFSVPLHFTSIISDIRSKADYCRLIRPLALFPFNDAVAQTLYPISKAEAALRRLFLSDTTHGLGKYKYWFLRYSQGLKYTLVNGLALWAQSSDLARYLTLILVSSKLNSNDTILALKTLSDWGKHHDAVPERLSLYVEAHNLGGHKVSDPSFKIREAAVPFYTGANVHETDFHSQLHYETVYNELLHITPSMPIPKLPFEEWVRLHTWETSGSSSFGRLVLPGGKTIKPRKNMLPMEYTDDEIINLCMQYNGTQQHSLLIKQEPLKIRLAVASDFVTYMWQSYALYLIEDFIYNYPGISLKEDLKAEYQRRKIACSLMRDRIVMSFDYEKFDHQVRTKSIQAICLPLLQYIKSKYPHLMSRHIEAALYTSWDHQTLTNALVQPVDKHKVEDGLMSGVRLTSLIGNIWNSNHNLWTSQIVPLDLWNVRGDDSLAITDTTVNAHKYIDVMSVFGAFGSYSKTLIRRESGEFLRTIYSPSGTYAYVARALLAAVERKPWSNDPVQPFERITNVINACKTAVLRGSNDVYWPIVARNFRKTYKIDPILLAIPKMLGGLGLFYKPVFNKLARPPCPTSFPIQDLPLPDQIPKNLKAAASRLDLTPNEYYWSLMLNDNVRGISNEISYLSKQVVTACQSALITDYKLMPLSMRFLNLVLISQTDPESIISNPIDVPGKNLAVDFRTVVDRGFLPVFKVGNATLTYLLEGTCPFPMPPSWPDYLSKVFGCIFWSMLKYVGSYYPYARRALVLTSLVAIYTIVSRLSPPIYVRT